MYVRKIQFKTVLQQDAISERSEQWPPRSPDLNPIENLFHLVSKQLIEDAIDKRITSENFEQFSDRVKRTMTNLSK